MFINNLKDEGIICNINRKRQNFEFRFSTGSRSSNIVCKVGTTLFRLFCRESMCSSLKGATAILYNKTETLTSNLKVDFSIYILTGLERHTGLLRGWNRPGDTYPKDFGYFLISYHSKKAKFDASIFNNLCYFFIVEVR